MIEENQKPVPKPDGEYVRLGIRSHAKGTFHEVVAEGEGLDVDTMYVVEANNLIVNITFAWEEAWAITSEKDAEKLVSHRFPQYRFHQGQYPMFYQYRFRNGRMKYNLELASPGGAGRNRVLNKTEFMKIPVTIPTSYEEEKKIGDLFANLDNLITLHQREYFSFDFGGGSAKNVQKTLSWEQRKLGEVSDRVKGNDGRMDLPTLTISAGSGWLDQKDRFSANIAGKEQENYTLLHKGELSYNHGNSKLAKYGAVFSLRTYEEALVPRVYHSFKVIEADADYIEYLFATKLPDKELGKLISSGARMDGLLNINYDEFMGISISMPSIEEQKKISSYLRSLDSIITLHQHKPNKKGHDVLTVMPFKGNQRKPHYLCT